MNGSREVICQWLGIPRDPWPPDHYTLLGLPAGEPSVDVIEQRVQERMESVRRYQLMNPEPATEAMNRLAQAFACLSDPAAKRAYDRDKFGLVAPVPEPAVAVAQPAAATQVVAADETPESAEVIRWDKDAPPPGPPPPPAAPAPAPVDPLVRAARTRVARRGLGTKKALYFRITRTRALLAAWELAGKYLSNPRRRPRNPAEARELISSLREVLHVLTEFPAILGEAGQPGYLVVSLARQSPLIPTFQGLLPSQREALARDWDGGQRLLTAHKQFLRTEVKALRRKPVLLLGMRVALAYLGEHPVGVLVAIGLTAVAIAIWRTVEMVSSHG